MLTVYVIVVDYSLSLCQTYLLYQMSLKQFAQYTSFALKCVFEITENINIVINL